MKISISMVQNEGDIIEYFIRANLRLVDCMVVVCNPSGDATRRVLSKLVSEGAPVIVWDMPRNRYEQPTVLTYCYEAVKEVFCPEFVFFLDADEILCERHAGELERGLKSMDPAQIALLPWKTHVPGDTPAYRFAPEEFSRRLAVEPTQYYKIVIPRRAAGAVDLRIEAGAHAVRVPQSAPVGATVLEAAWIAHVPVRSEPQLRAKVLGGVLAKVIARGEGWYRTRESYQWKKLFGKLLAGERVDARKAALEYVISGSGGKAAGLERDRDGTELIMSQLPSIQCRYACKEVPADVMVASRVFWSLVGESGVESVLGVGGQTAEGGLRQEHDPTIGAARQEQVECDWPPFRYLCDLIRPNSVLGVGCGDGAYLKVFKEYGAEVFGLEAPGLMAPRFLSAEEYASAEWQDGGFPALGKYDLVLCLSLPRELPSATTERVVDFLFDSAGDALALSACWQHGESAACADRRVIANWMDLVEKKGWSLDHFATLGARLLSTAHRFRRDLLIVRRNPIGSGTVDPAECRRRILEISEQAGQWPDGPGGGVVSFCGCAPRYRLSDNRRIDPVGEVTGSAGPEGEQRVVSGPTRNRGRWFDRGMTARVAGRVVSYAKHLVAVRR